MIKLTFFYGQKKRIVFMILIIVIVTNRMIDREISLSIFVKNVQKNKNYLHPASKEFLLVDRKIANGTNYLHVSLYLRGFFFLVVEGGENFSSSVILVKNSYSHSFYKFFLFHDIRSVTISAFCKHFSALFSCP